MQTEGGGGADTEEEEVPMQQYALNLEGHFKPQVGFMPHVFRVDGDFATGDAKYALKYDAATGSAASEVEVCGIGPSYEDFVAGFAPTSDPGWSVDPQDGCLDVNGGDNDVLNVRYTGLCDAPKFGTLVVVLPTENHSWTFKFRVEP
mmetsp:Transcript_68445/g.111095  ORF Transcript_68445/g.111095 Transcript_68445/m.111095 type:complete len:147 (-) Transcript_68445:647-1087(-)